MSNFAFLPEKFKTISESAIRAEGHIMSDPRAACFHARFALEAAVHWLYRHDNSLNMPYDQKLGALLHEPSFQNLVPEAVFQKARVILKMGNQAVHSPRPVQERDALQVVRELHHFCYWLTRTYSPEAGTYDVIWSLDRVPGPVDRAAVVPRNELQELEQQLARQNRENLKQQKERDVLDAQIQALREQLAEIKTRAEQQSDPHDYSEIQTRHYLIDVELKRAGWPLIDVRDREYEVTGMPGTRGTGYADYVLWGDDGKPLAVVEAKKSTLDPVSGRQQAKLYADCLESMHGQRPVIFYTNGYQTWIWDDVSYPPRKIAGFYKKEELARLVRRREQRTALDVTLVREAIAGRYYQKRAVGSIFRQFAQARRKALLVMATGTGKTRIAIALVDALQRAGWVKRALFLADRVSLVKQAVNAFKAHLPESSPVNLITEKDGLGRVYVSTYPTMMGLIDETREGTARFGVGHFDLVIIDEAHRSVYQKYGAIFEYFDSMLVGLTATPSEHVDRNTYDLFDLEPGVPTDAYELSEAVRDDFLVRPRVEQVDLRFPREGIDYDSLSEEEKEQWESLDWGDDAHEYGMPKQVNASAINNWLFNKDTVDKVLMHVMQNGHKVEAGDRLAKTIIFARNHDHAVFIEERFNHHYPHLAGHFARVIDNQARYAQTLIDDFSIRDKAPHIAISVDMLDTGIDIPEAANLVFFKPVYSRIKFWQMIGRGTRLCPDLFGPGEDKQDFRVFDFCFNFDFFRENPEGIEAGPGESLGIRLFKARVELLSHVQSSVDLPEQSGLRRSLIKELYGEVAAMNPDNFIVRMRLKDVQRFQKQDAWEKISEHDREVLQNDIAGLPSEKETDDIESRLFDLIALSMQLALIQGNIAMFERQRKKAVDIAMLLEDKAAIPAVRSQLTYLAAMQNNEFWEGMTLDILEDMRLRLRLLTPFLDKRNRKVVYTDFQDEVVGVRVEETLAMPRMTSSQYAKKVKEYLKNHHNHLVIQRLRSNQPLTARDLQSLEKTLQEIGEEEGETLLSGLLERSNAPSLAHFIRSMVGLDRKAAQAVFSDFLSDHTLTPDQIRFIEMIIDQLTARGFMEAGALYEAPFTSLHSGGPDGLFAGKDNVIDGIFQSLDSTRPRVLDMAG